MKVAKKTLALWQRAKQIIPGGVQLFSKRAEIYAPQQWPAYYQKAKGVAVWDLDGNKYIDMCYMGIGSCVLGYADPDVARAVKKVIGLGSMTTLNCPEEVELAELLLQLHPWAQMVRYGRAGGEAMAMAVRIARAYTGKDKVAFSGYHGWHDWYLSTNLANDKNLDTHLIPGLTPRGVPKVMTGLTLPFAYNQAEELEKLVAEHSDIGTIIIEPSRHVTPTPEFFKQVRAIANRIGAVLVIDEITVGWKENLGGFHLLYGLEPDIAVYAKGIASGYPMAALVGRREVMQAVQDTFVSSTFWTERIGPTAALATIKKIRTKNVPKHLKTIGRMIQTGWSAAAKKHDLNIIIGEGTVIMPEFRFNYGDQNQAIRTLLTQEMLKRGFLEMGCVYVTYAHKAKHIKKYLQAIDAVFALLASAIRDGTVTKKLAGPIAQNRYVPIN